MKAGDAYYTNYNLLTQFIAYAPIDGLCFKAGANPSSWILESPIGVAEISYSRKISPFMAVNFGATYLYYDWNYHSIGLSPKLTIGNENKSISGGISFAQLVDNIDFFDPSIIKPFTIAGNLRLNNKNHLTAEMFSVKFTQKLRYSRSSAQNRQTEIYFGMIGIRHEGKRNMVSYGVSIYTNNHQLNIPLPFVALTYRL